MKICSYTLTVDSGFAPNPFHGCCTLAACTPNHMGARLDEGDYLAGFFTVRGEPYLVYWMKVDGVLDYHAYFTDSQFQKKKPNMNGSWIDRCGDNMYHRDPTGEWVQEKSPHHHSHEQKKQDTRHSVVYFGKTFAYFGKESCSQQNRLDPVLARTVLKKGKGIKYTRDSDPEFARYLRWLQSKPVGRHADPRDREDACGSRQLDAALADSSRVTSLQNSYFESCVSTCCPSALRQ